MPVIGLAVLVRNHAHQFRPFHFRAERAAHAAVSAGGHHAVVGLAFVDDVFFDQRCRRTGLHAGAAGHAFGFHERLVFARRHHGGEAAPVDGQRERALHFLAGSHAARADDAFARVEGEIGIGSVFPGLQVILALVAVTHFAQAHHTGHVLQFAIAVGGASQAIERMIGDVQLHHATADVRELRRLRAHFHPWRDGGGTGGGIAFAAIDLDQAQAAGAKSFEAVGRAEFGNLDTGIHRRAHDRRALGHADFDAVDFQRDQLFRHALRRAVINRVLQGRVGLHGHGGSPSRPEFRPLLVCRQYRNLRGKI